MIKKISVALFIPCLILAIFLSINGVHEVNLSTEFYSFMRRVAVYSYQIDIKIPNIPSIPLNTDAVQGLQQFINFWITFVNTLSAILNGIIYLLNTLLQVITFFIVIFSNFKEFMNALVSGIS